VSVVVSLVDIFTIAGISIVFVHGFGGHRIDTWTLNGFCWPREYLKSKLERARIISFGYEADVRRLLPQSGTLSDYASELLSSLAKLRANECHVIGAFDSPSAREN
jgi:protein SERAC1